MKYRVRKDFAIQVGFDVNQRHVLGAAELTNEILAESASLALSKSRFQDRQFSHWINLLRYLGEGDQSNREPN